MTRRNIIGPGPFDREGPPPWLGVVAAIILVGLGVASLIICTGGAK